MLQSLAVPSCSPPIGRCANGLRGERWNGVQVLVISAELGTAADTTATTGAGIVGPEDAQKAMRERIAWLHAELNV